MLQSISSKLEHNNWWYFREGELSISEETTSTYPKISYCIGTILPTFGAIFSCVLKENSFLHKVTSMPLDGLRIHSLLQDLKKGEDKDLKLVQLGLAVSSLVGTFFYHPIGLVISTGQDLIFSIAKLRKNEELNYQKVESFLQALNKASYLACFFTPLPLACFFTPLPEVKLLFLLAQIFLNSSYLYKNFSEMRHEGVSAKEFVKAIGNIALLTVRVLYFYWSFLGALELRGFISTEYMVEQFLGEEYLHFIPGDERDKLLVLNTSDDPRGSFSSKSGSLLQDLELLSDRFDIRFHNISKVNEIKEEIDLAQQAGKVMGLVLRGHGLSKGKGIVFSNSLEGILYEKSLSLDLFQGLDPQCIIVLDSCETAFDENSIAYRICNIAKRTVYASPDKVCNLDSFVESINPLKWYLGEHTVKLTPIIEEALSETVA